MTETAIATRQPTTLTPAGIDFSQEQIETIKKTIAKGASDTELDLFLAICRRTGLDPFLKQIHLIERRTKDGDRWVSSRQPLVGIDGMRLVAKRTGNFDSVDIAWLNDDGEWSEVWKGHGVPVAAKATVYKYQGRPQTAICRYDSYVQTTSNGQPNSVWAKSPDNQIAKCAESLALRRSFPAEMSALASSVSINLEDTTAYEIEAGERYEVHSATNVSLGEPAGVAEPDEVINADYRIDPEDLPFESKPADDEREPEEPSPATDPQLKAIAENARRLSWTDAQTLSAAAEEFAITLERVEDLTAVQAKAFLERQAGLLSARGKVGVTA